MIRRPSRSTQSRSSAASDVYKRQRSIRQTIKGSEKLVTTLTRGYHFGLAEMITQQDLSLIHISEPTRLLSILYAVFCLKKKKTHIPL